MIRALVTVGMAAAAAHQPSVAVSRLPAIVDAARTYCPEPSAKKMPNLSNDEREAVQQFKEKLAFQLLKFTLAEKAAFMGMCVLYRQGRLEGLEEGAIAAAAPPEH